MGSIKTELPKGVATGTKKEGKTRLNSVSKEEFRELITSLLVLTSSNTVEDKDSKDESTITNTMPFEFSVSKPIMKLEKNSVKNIKRAPITKRRLLEYPEGFYLVGNAFCDVKEAITYAQSLQKLGFEQARIIHDEEANNAYVSVESYDSKAALDSFYETVKLEFKGDLWILQVAH